MWCPKCCARTKVIGTSTGIQNERFRKCVKCGYTFSTIEAIKFDSYWREYAKETFKQDNKSEFERKEEFK